jgi:heme acquisition protein HasR
MAMLVAAPVALVAWSRDAHAEEAGDADRKIRFDIPSQSLSTALLAYAEQANVQLIVPAEALAGLKAIALSGEFDAQTALRALLAQSNLGFEVTGPRTITVMRKSAQ